MKLLAIALVTLLAVGVALAEEWTLRVYDISTLEAPRLPTRGPRLGAHLPKLYGSSDWDDREPTRFLQGEALADLVRDTIDTETWDEGADVQAREGGVLLVMNRPETLRRIEALLGELQKAASRRVLFEVEVLDLPAESYSLYSGGTPGTTARPEGALRESASTEAYPGIWTTVKMTNRVRYVSDYEPEIAQGANISDPVVDAAEEGLVVDLVPHPTSDGSRILVEALVQEGRFDRPFRTADLGLDEEYMPRQFRSDRRHHYGRVQLPVLRHVDSYSTHLVASGETFAVPILVKDRVKVLLVTSKLLGGDSAAPMVDLGALAHRPDVHTFGYPDEWEEDALPLMAPRIYAHEGSHTLMGPEELMDMIQYQVEPSYWEQGGSLCVMGAGKLFVGATDEVRAKIRRFVKAREDFALRQVGIDLRIYSVAAAPTPGARRTYEPEGAKLEYAGRVATIPGRSASVMGGSTMNFLADYRVEVAQDARIADPDVGQSFEGLVANLTPRLGSDGQTMRIDVELLLSSRDYAGEFDTGTQFLGPVDAVTETRKVVNTSVELPVGYVYVLDGGAHPKSEGRRLAVVIRTTLE